MRTEWINQDLPDAAADSGSLTSASRRNFMKTSGVLGGGLVLGFFIPAANKFAAAQPAQQVYAPNAFLHIGADNIVTVAVNRLEFGQGVNTSLPMLIAEELDADWSLVRSALAPAGDMYKDPMFGMQMTGGSGSISRSYMQHR